MSGREGDTPAQAMFSNIDDIKITGDNEITITLKFQIQLLFIT